MDLSYKSVTKYIFKQDEAVERFSANSSDLCCVELALKGVLLICTLLGSNGQLKMGLTVQTPDGFVMLISFDKGKTVVHGHGCHCRGEKSVQMLETPTCGPWVVSVCHLLLVCFLLLNVGRLMFIRR